MGNAIEETQVDQRHEELLRRLAVHDEAVLHAALQMDVSAMGAPALDTKTCGLVRLAACVASQASSQSFEWSVAASLDAGASVDEVVGVLLAVAPVVGSARVHKAAVDIATAVGLETEDRGRA